MDSVSSIRSFVVGSGSDRQVDQNNATQSQENAKKDIYSQIFKYIDDNYYHEKPQVRRDERTIFYGIRSRDWGNRGNQSDNHINAKNVNEFQENESDFQAVAEKINNSSIGADSQNVEARHIREFVTNFNRQSNTAYIAADDNRDKQLSNDEVRAYVGSMFALQPDQSNAIATA